MTPLLSPAGPDEFASAEYLAALKAKLGDHAMGI